MAAIGQVMAQLDADTCDACRTTHQSPVTLENFGEVSHTVMAHCTNENGCRCHIVLHRFVTNNIWRQLMAAFRGRMGE